MEHVDSGFGQRGEQFLQSCRVVGDFRRCRVTRCPATYWTNSFGSERIYVPTDTADRWPHGPASQPRWSLRCAGAVGPDYPIIFRFSQWKGTDYAKRHRHRCRICAWYMGIACMHGTPQI